MSGQYGGATRRVRIVQGGEGGGGVGVSEQYRGGGGTRRVRSVWGGTRRVRSVPGGGGGEACPVSTRNGRGGRGATGRAQGGLASPRGAAPSSACRGTTRWAARTGASRGARRGAWTRDGSRARAQGHTHPRARQTFGSAPAARAASTRAVSSCTTRAASAPRRRRGPPPRAPAQRARRGRGAGFARGLWEIQRLVRSQGSS